jgi:hypothetical protein
MKGDKIKYRKGYKYQLADNYDLFVGIYPVKNIKTDWVELSRKGILSIKKGYAWDGASGPTVDTADTMRGSLVHDALYQLLRLGLLPESCRIKADELLHDICCEDGMSEFRADLWKAMVNDFAGYAAKYGTEQSILIAP